MCKKCDDIITFAGSGHHLRPGRMEPGAPYFGKSLPVRPPSLPEFLRWFHLSGYVNSQNSRIWASENPNAIHEEPPHSEKTGVWCGMSRRCIIGPIFFDATITTAAYMGIFNTFVNQLDDEELSVGYFQQDRATSHTSHASMAEIQFSFGDRVI